MSTVAKLWRIRLVDTILCNRDSNGPSYDLTLVPLSKKSDIFGARTMKVQILAIFVSFIVVCLQGLIS